MITSTNNNIIKATRKLLDKKYRYEDRLYLVEGIKLVKEAIRYHADIKYIIKSVSVDFDCGDIICYEAEDFVLSSITEVVTNQGIIAVVGMPGNTPIAPVTKCLILDNLQDPGNLGTILRTCAATGYNNVYLANSVDVFSPKVVRSAMSAHFCLNFFQGKIEEIFDCVKKHCQILVADMNGENVFHTTVESMHAIVVGNEGNGISDYSRANCDKIISLPMKNNFESLNAGVSASVLMYELSNKED